MDKISPDDEVAILNAVDRRHCSEGEMPLHEYLGWTWEEYARWISKSGVY